jgi:RsiW-degrading membrane proteinase PrsW (M82 family)
VLSPGATELAARVRQRPPDGLLATAVAAPMTEEFGKAILLLSLFLFRRIHTSMDGLVLGLAAGLGFTTIENIVWFTVTLAEQGEEAMWTSMRVRVLFGTLVHGTSSALFGAYLGGALANGRRWVVVLAPLAALTAATVVHGAWNGLLATADGRGSYVMLALLVMLVALSVVIVLARHELWRAGFLRATWVPDALRSRRYPERRGAEGKPGGADVTR